MPQDEIVETNGKMMHNAITDTKIAEEILLSASIALPVTLGVCRPSVRRELEFSWDGI